MTDLFSQALALHRAGRLDEAESLYQTVLDSSPNNADCLNLLGVIAHQRGDNATAVELIRRAIEIRFDRPAYHCNLSAACRGLGQFEQAAASARAAVALQPNQPESHLNLGLALMGAGEFEQAESVFSSVAARWPKDPRGPQSLGDCFREQERAPEAIAAYRQALTLQPNHGQVQLILGTLLLTSEGPAAAEAHLRRAAELLPNDVSALINLGTCLTGLGRDREAIDVYEQALRLAPNDTALSLLIGQGHAACREWAKAEKWYAAVLQIDPGNAEAVCGLADVFTELGRHAEAIALYERSVQLTQTPEVYRRFAKLLLMDFGDNKRAESLIREAAARFPDDPLTFWRLGSTLAINGDIDGAVEAFRSALRVKPDYAPALAELATMLGKRLPEHERAAIETAIRQPGSEEDIAGLHFALAHLEDVNENFDRAADHLRQGNALIKSYGDAHGRRYDPKAMGQRFDRLLAKFNREFFARTAGFGLATEKPVFVFGMPRSGTTLVEQILASHPRIYGGDEWLFADQSSARLPEALGLKLDPVDCLDRATPAAIQTCANWYLEQINRVSGGTSDRVVDKRLDNSFNLGWLATLFPKARFIHCRRDLRDIALSCWMTNFSAINWANDIGLIAGRIREYLRFMDHWKSVLPAPVLDVDYEKVVADQEAESRRLIEWIGLDWDPACLEFHRSKRPVRTASLAQVRKPIYNRSVGRWRHYVETLRPLIDELGLGYE